MSGDNAHAEAIRAAFRGGDCSQINIIAVSVRAAALIEEGCRGIANVTIIHFAIVGFYSHILWIDRAEMDSRRELQGFSDQIALPIFVSNLNIRNFYFFPIHEA